TKLSKVERAVLGAEILDGRAAMLNPTLAMLAQALDVSIAYLLAARRLSPGARQEVARGQRPLVRSQRPSPAAAPHEKFANAVAEMGGIAGARAALAVIERNGNGHG